MSELDENPTLDRFIKDVRSPLARLLGDGPIAHRVFEFDGAAGRCKGQPFAVRWLSAEARQRAAVDALKFLVDKCGWDRGDLFAGVGEAVLDLETKIRMLAVGLVDPADPRKPFAKDADELRAKFDVDEVAALFEELADFASERSVLSKIRKWEEVEGLVAALGKGLARKNSLNICDVASLRFIIIELARRHYAPTRPPSSDTTSASASDPSSIEETEIS